MPHTVWMRSKSPWPQGCHDSVIPLHQCNFLKGVIGHQWSSWSPNKAINLEDPEDPHVKQLPALLVGPSGNWGISSYANIDSFVLEARSQKSRDTLQIPSEGLPTGNPYPLWKSKTMGKSGEIINGEFSIANAHSRLIPSEYLQVDQPVSSAWATSRWSSLIWASMSIRDRNTIERET